MGSSGSAVPGASSGKPLLCHPPQNLHASLPPSRVVLLRPLLCPVLLARDVDRTRIRVTPVVNSYEDRPMNGARSVASAANNCLLKRELTDEAVGQKPAFRIVFLSHDAEPLSANERCELH